jgi:hypothetical protein
MIKSSKNWAGRPDEVREESSLLQRHMDRCIRIGFLVVVFFLISEFSSWLDMREGRRTCLSQAGADFSWGWGEV